MSLNRYASPLQFEIRSSARLNVLTYGIYAGAMAMTGVSNLYFALKILTVLILAGTMWLNLVRNGTWKAPLFFKAYTQRFRRAVWMDDGNWVLFNADGDESGAQLRSGCFVHPLLTIINLRLVDAPWYSRHRVIILTADNIDAENFRRLRVRLRWYSTLPSENSVAVE